MRAADVSSLGAKLQLARRLAETVSRVHDPLIRGEVVNKASARLGVSPADFGTLISTKPRGGLHQSHQSLRVLRLRQRRDTTLRCFAFWRYAMRRHEIFFSHRVGARFSSKCLTRKFSSAFFKASCILTILHRSALSWPRSPPGKRHLFPHGCYKKCLPTQKRWLRNGGLVFAMPCCGADWPPHRTA